MDYQIILASDQLVFIRWLRESTSMDVETQFLSEIQALLDNAEQPLYFISDLRKGRIVNVESLRELGELTKHANCGGETGFTNNPYTTQFMKLFARFAAKPQSSRNLANSPEQSIAYLESLVPGLTQGIDWDALLEMK